MFNNQKLLLFFLIRIENIIFLDNIFWLFTIIFTFFLMIIV